MTDYSIGRAVESSLPASPWKSPKRRPPELPPSGEAYLREPGSVLPGEGRSHSLAAAAGMSWAVINRSSRNSLGTEDKVNSAAVIFSTRTIGRSQSSLFALTK